MQINKFITSKPFIIITWILAFLIVIFVVFSIGVRVGYSKASHNFERRGMSPKFMPHGTGTPSTFMERGELRETHGVSGVITEITSNTITVEDRNREARKIVVSTDTKIRSKEGDITIESLNNDDFIIVFGNTDANEQVIAKLIRVTPKDKDLKPIM